ncbi:MAG: VWA domain-containing protein [Aureliella sp.]
MNRWALGGSLSLAIIVAVAAAVVAIWLYRRELAHAPEKKRVWILPMLRILAIALVALTLAQPQLESLWQAEKPGQVAFLLDGSESMTLADDAIGSVGRLSRFARATKPTHDISGPWQSVFAEATTTVFQALGGRITRLRELTPIAAATQDTQGTDLRDPTPPDSGQGDKTWLPSRFSPETPLGEQLIQVASSLRSAARQNNVESTAIVLLTDGVNNSGRSLVDAAEKLAEDGIAVYPIGFGTTRQPTDLVMANIVAPQSVFRSAKVAGTLVYLDFIPPGNTASVQIRSGPKILWKQDIQCAGVGQRSVGFAFPAELLLDGVDVQSATAHTASLTASIQLSDGSEPQEATLENNQLGVLVNVLSDTSRVLLIDQHSRWETRYLKNLFERDPTWECQVRIVGNDDSLPTLPTQAELGEVDLVILGDVRHEAIPADQQSQLIEFVSLGGGLMVIDGASGHLHAPEYANLRDILPVEWPESAKASSTSTGLNMSTRLTPAGLALPAFNLAATSEEATAPAPETANQQAWEALPELQFVSSSRANAESEVLVEVASAVDSKPLIVTQRFGRGRVLYVASDQTWRWRYKQGDNVHGRIWNQLARWVGRKQSRVKNDYVSLDSSVAFAESGTPVELVCQLLGGRDEQQLDDVIAKVTDESGNVIRRIRLINSERNQFRATVSDLPKGSLSVSVEAEGFTSDALNIQLPLLITDKPSSEMQVVACAESELRELARATGGEYLHESDLDRLPERLVAYRGSRIQSQIFNVWSSYYWFAAALILLSIEWLLRKRFGLI